ncbi:MAG: restriction endonuclease subunit S [Planctomycetota bacterium]
MKSSTLIATPTPEWPHTPLKDVVIFDSGSRNSDTAATNGEYPFFVCSSEILRCDEFDFDAEAVIMAGNNANGVFHMHHYIGPFAARQRTYVIRPSCRQLDCRYLFHQLQTLQSSFRDQAIGTTTQYVTIGMLRNAVIPLPAIAEQEAIAEALEDADAWIESLEQLAAKKRHIKLAAMQQLLTGKTRLPGFEGQWSTQSIGGLFHVGGGLSASRDQLTHDGICYLHYGDIHGSTKNYIDLDCEHTSIPKLDIPISKVSRASLLDDGDVVFVDASEDVDGTNKHVVVINPNSIPFISGLHTIVAKPKTDEISSHYCRYCFETASVKQQFRFYAVGMKVSGVSKTNIAKIEIEVPSKPEQDGIARILMDIDAEIEAIEAKLAKARQIKQGMMQELLTGRTRLI